MRPRGAVPPNAWRTQGGVRSMADDPRGPDERQPRTVAWAREGEPDQRLRHEPLPTLGILYVALVEGFAPGIGYHRVARPFLESQISNTTGVHPLHADRLR